MHPDQPQARSTYKTFSTLPTRWLDNDIYGHVNNVNYYSFFDTAIADYLMGQGGLDPWNSQIIGFCVESGCRFRKAIQYPEVITAGLRVTKIGRSSVRYEIGLFKGEDEESAADGYFVHVFVDRRSETPTPVPDAIRNALSKVTVSTD